MIHLPSIFSDNALYQQNSILKIHGTCIKNTDILVDLLKESTVVSHYETRSDAEGHFTITIKTPKASFACYDLHFYQEQQTAEVWIKNILFGEVWLATGQSNMELQNYFIPQKEELLKQCQDKKLRFYRQEPFGKIVENQFPYEVCENLDGKWCNMTDKDDFLWVSACASAAVLAMYDFMNKNAAVPVGFINSVIGGTSIETWLPRSALAENPLLFEGLNRSGRFPTPENWNKAGDGNYNQPSALYNLKIYPLKGMQLRGVLWYQGEANVGGREAQAYYASALRTYHKTYADLFASAGENDFPMICSQLYPWLYTNSGACNMGYINNAFLDVSKADPKKFMTVPIYDFKPIWSVTLGNHPIHPVHKYPLGQRMGQIAVNNCYGGDGLRSAISFSSCKREENALLLHFSLPKGKRLHCTEERIKGFYVAANDKNYVEAEATLVDEKTVRVSNPWVDAPKYAAYQFTNMERNGNLWCDELPLSPFATQQTGAVVIHPKPWIHTEIEQIWVQKEVTDVKFDSYYYPTWYAAENSALCRDDVFCETKASLRIFGTTNTIGAYVVNNPGNCLDLYHYAEIRFDAFDAKKIGGYVELEWKPSISETRKLRVNMEKRCDKENGFCEFAVNLSGVPSQNIEKLAFYFDVTEKLVKATHLDHITLVVKK